MSKKPAQRRFETVFVQSDKPLDLRVVCDLLIKKLKRGELNGIDKSKIQRIAYDDCKYNDVEKH